jgi:pimeloyl-ACP methyl ester carboxylesterase
MTVAKEYFQIENKFGDILSGDIYYPVANKGKSPLIIISHGFKGFKDWGFFPYISNLFALRNSIVICFNFSHNGNPNREMIITDTKKFADNTISKEINDLEFIISIFTKDIVEEFSRVKEIWNGSIFLLGHSLGGGVSLLVARKNPLVKKVALWASIAKFDRYTERQKNEWKKQGYIEFTNQRTNQLLRMNIDYLEDIEENKYNLPLIISQMSIPVLLIHGKQDVTVPMKEAQILIDSDVNNILSYEIIENTGHIFGIEHPFFGTTPALENAINLTFDFFKL